MSNINLAEVDAAYSALQSGGLILIRVDVGYALMGHSEPSMRKMFELKGRSLENPAIVIGSLDVLLDVGQVEGAKLTWIKEQMQWTTLAVVVPKRPDSRLWQRLPAWVQTYASVGDTVAVFLNTGEFSDRLVERAYRDNFLITGSSANQSSTGNRYAIADIPEKILQGADFLLDHGRPKYANPERRATTIVNLSSKNPEEFFLKRRGVNAEAIEASLKQLQTRMMTEEFAPVG